MQQLNAWMVWMQQHSIVAVVAAFLLIVLATYWPGRRTAIEQHGRIPLDDGS